MRSSEHVGQLADANAHDGPRDDDDADDEFWCTVHLERRGRLEVMLGARDRRVVIADQERLARFRQESRREQEADTDKSRFMDSESRSRDLAQHDRRLTMERKRRKQIRATRDWAKRP